MNVSSIGSNSYNMFKLYSQMSSAKRINSAADDPAGMAIAQKMQSQSTTYQAGNKNIADSQNLINSAEGGMSGVTDSLQRIRELSVQAQNGTYSDSDKQSMQNEINQLKDHINSVSQSAQFNGISTLNGSGLRLNGANDTLQFDLNTDNLGISEYDITGDFDIGAIDKALNTVSSMRGTAGGVANTMGHTLNSNEIADLNTQAAQSRIEDADMARTIMELKKNQIFQQSGIYVQRQRQQQMAGVSGGILNLLT